MMSDGYHTISNTNIVNEDQVYTTQVYTTQVYTDRYNVVRFTNNYKLFVYISELEHIKLPGVYSFVLNSIYGFP